MGREDQEERNDLITHDFNMAGPESHKVIIQLNLKGNLNSTTFGDR